MSSFLAANLSIISWFLAEPMWLFHPLDAFLNINPNLEVCSIQEPANLPKLT